MEGAELNSPMIILRKGSPRGQELGNYINWNNGGKTIVQLRAAMSQRTVDWNGVCQSTVTD